MNARQIFRAQHDFVHQMLDNSIADCSDDVLNRVVEGSLTNTIGGTYAHALFTADLLLVAMVQGRPTVFADGGWTGKLGLEIPQSPVLSQEWAAGVRINLEPCREYAAAVRDAINAYVAEAPEEQLTRSMSLGPMETTAIGLIGILGVYHVASHQGEIAALKGLAGLKGQTF